MQSEPVRKPRVLLGLSGSVATIKAVELTKELLTFADVRVVHTKAAGHFVDVAQLVALGVAVLSDADEWSAWRHLLDPVLHIELRKWADVFVIAPLSANSLAKLCTGQADNLLTCVARAWELGGKPFIAAPAMNTMMWTHPVTASQLSQLAAWGIDVVAPVAKRLACGDTGVGAMASVGSIVKVVRRAAINGRLHPRSARSTVLASRWPSIGVAGCLLLAAVCLALRRRS
eukprot:TRINITY_DN7475_c0_g1_i1.p1 TRINITY_DN7475_c0_g1~~TRINITY_DN7475_c0_g1_i1.p1  ORF type:complete len:230 (-),score=55.47 TRINITY_DN7475_c0_g1_i1:268-957(-)